MRAYFFVITPLNYLYALQASKDERFKFEEKHLIILSNYHRSLSQFKEIVDDSDWNSIQYPWKNWNNFKKNKIQLLAIELFKFYMFWTIYRKIKKSNAIAFWGNYNHNYFQMIVRKFDSIYLIDDGFATVNSLIGIEKKARTLEKTKKISLYTIFNLTSKSIEIVMHDFNKIRISDYNPSYPKRLYFIGQPLVYSNVVSNEYYTNYIDTVFASYDKKGFECFYLPHRSTTKDYIPKYWKTLEFDFPIELIGKFNTSSPAIFATFYSTAVYNVFYYLGLNRDQCIFWEIPSEQISDGYKNIITPVYNYIRNNNFTLNNLNDLEEFENG